MPKPVEILLCALSLLAAPALAADDVVPIAPFAGESSEDLEHVTTLPFFITVQIDVFGGDMSFVSGIGMTSIHLWHGSCLSGDCSVPRSGIYLIGATTPQRLDFHVPARRFGAWFTNTSGADGATAVFRDAAGAVLATHEIAAPAAGTDWYWNGWEATGAPIASIEITSHGALGGFIWLDDLELDAAPLAACAERNGSGANPDGFACASPPVLGGAWSATLDAKPSVGSTTAGFVLLVGLGGPTTGPLTASGELLVLPPLVALPVVSRTPAFGMPSAAALEGLAVSVQALRVEREPSATVLLNAVDLVLGY